MYYPVAAILGGILGWLMFSNNGRLKELELSANREKAVSNDLLTEFNKYKTDKEAALNMRSAEVDLLKKKLAAALKMPQPQANGELDSLRAQVKTYKLKVKSLEEDLAFADSSNIASIESSKDSKEQNKEFKQLKKANKTLQSELESSQKRLLQQSEEIKTLKAQPKAGPKSKAPTALLDSQAKIIAKLKAKLEAKKKSRKKAKKKHLQLQSKPSKKKKKKKSGKKKSSTKVKGKA